MNVRTRRPLFRSILLLGTLSVLALCSPRATAQSGITSEGTDFWVAFMPNYTGPAEYIQLFVASGTKGNVHVEEADFSKSVIVSPDKATTISLPFNVEERRQEEPEYKAIHVTSDNPISLYGYSNIFSSSDSYLALPTSALGTDYFVSCMYDDNFSELGLQDPLAGEFVIVAPYDSTVVTIGPVRANTRSDDTGALSHKIGDTWNVTLKKGQTYLVQSTGLAVGIQDLTGTHISSTKPVGVISGHQRCRIPVDGKGNPKDMVMEMMLPTDRWGTEYYDVPQAGRIACGSAVRIIAGEDNCYITQNGMGIAQFKKAGDFTDLDLELDPSVYRSNGKKFLVVEYSYSQNFNGDQIQTDPYEIIMTPRNLFEKRMLFTVASNPITKYDNYATFICSKDSVSHILLNGKPLTTHPFAATGVFSASTNGAMAYYTVKLSGTSPYLATCGAPFACYAYGRALSEAYGHPAGMALNIPSSDTLAPLETKRDTVSYQVCLEDSRANDSRIAAIGLINDSSDYRWPKASQNFAIAYTSGDPLSDSGSLARVCLSLQVQNIYRDGYAALWVTDRAGNDTVYEYYYKAHPKGILIATPLTYDFGTVDTGQSKMFTFKITNTGNAPDTISTLTLKDQFGAFAFTATPPATTILLPNGSLNLAVTFRPRTAGSFAGSIEAVEIDGVNSALVAFNGKGHITEPPPPPNSVPTGELAGALFSVIPNPSHGEAICKITLDHPETLRLLAIDELGREVFSQNLGVLGAGEHRIDAQLTSLPSGTYFLRLLSASGSSGTKVTIAR